MPIFVKSIKWFPFYQQCNMLEDAEMEVARVIVINLIIKVSHSIPADMSNNDLMPNPCFTFFSERGGSNVIRAQAASQAEILNREVHKYWPQYTFHII